jgi:hypothetical protein
MSWDRVENTDEYNCRIRVIIFAMRNGNLVFEMTERLRDWEIERLTMISDERICGHSGDKKCHLVHSHFHPHRSRRLRLRNEGFRPNIDRLVSEQSNFFRDKEISHSLPFQKLSCRRDCVFIWWRIVSHEICMASAMRYSNAFGSSHWVDRMDASISYQEFLPEHRSFIPKFLVLVQDFWIKEKTEEREHASEPDTFQRESKISSPVQLFKHENSRVGRCFLVTPIVILLWRSMTNDSRMMQTHSLRISFHDMNSDTHEIFVRERRVDLVNGNLASPVTNWTSNHHLPQASNCGDCQCHKMSHIPMNISAQGDGWAANLEPLCRGDQVKTDGGNKQAWKKGCQLLDQSFSEKWC